MIRLNNILNEPILIKGINENNSIKIHSITLKDYEKFQELSKVLYISKNHFQETDIPLLGLIFQSRESLQISYEELAIIFEQIFSLVTNQVVNFVSEGFVLEDSNIINVNNYEEIRKIIMNQNLMFEQKVYKNPKVQEWANLTMQAKSKNQPKIGMEEMITTVSTFTGKHYWDLKNYTMYQIYSDFYRIRKLKYFDFYSMAKCQGAEIDIEDFAENLDIYKNPYDNLFVSNDKLNKFD